MNHTEREVRRFEILYAFTAGAAFMGAAVVMLIVLSGGLACQ